MDAITPPPLATSARPGTGAEDLDIVIVHGGDLEAAIDPWRGVLQGYHLIVISTGEALVLQGLDHKSYTIADVQRSPAAGFLISSSAINIVAAQCFAVLVSTRKFVAFLDLKSAAPASDPATGELLDPFKQHLINLRSPSTPYFFNTLYDPFRAGADFVRGYPFSLRLGVPTAVSHGLWLDPQQQHYADLVMTVPKNTFFPLRSINLAFDRELVGPAMFLGAFQQDPVLGELWAGLCVKIVCDHLGFGVKLGIPYVAWKGDSSDAKKDDDEKLGEVLGFFQGIQLPESAKSAADCYLEIVNQIKAVKPKFSAAVSVDGLVAWSSAWKNNSS